MEYVVPSVAEAIGAVVKHPAGHESDLYSALQVSLRR